MIQQQSGSIYLISTLWSYCMWLFPITSSKTLVSSVYFLLWMASIFFSHKNNLLFRNWFTNTCIFLLYFYDLLWVIGRHWIVFQWLLEKNTNQILVELNKTLLNKYWFDFTTHSKNKLWGKVKLKLRTLHSACVELIIPHLLANQQTGLLDRKTKAEQKNNRANICWAHWRVKSGL